MKKLARDPTETFDEEVIEYTHIQNTVTRGLLCSFFFFGLKSKYACWFANAGSSSDCCAVENVYQCVLVSVCTFCTVRTKYPCNHRKKKNPRCWKLAGWLRLELVLVLSLVRHQN